MKQRWSRKQVKEKVAMFTNHLDRWHKPEDEKSLHFFTEKLFIMDFKGAQSVTIDTEVLFNL